MASEGQISIKVEFSGGLELLFSNKKSHQISLPSHLPVSPSTKPDEVSRKKPADISYLIHYLRDNLLKERVELFMEDETIYGRSINGRHPALSRSHSLFTPFSEGTPVLLSLSASPLLLRRTAVSFEYTFDFTSYKGFSAYNTPTGQSTIQRQWATYNPIMDATDPDIGCNNPGTTTDPQLTAAVPAGSSVTAFGDNP
ncbi:hypothetical protein EW145_g6894 [Phellinidium pouzarii]|uniref:Ubiquitin-related modifier 1 n=1 Tax=Phellinidium pouzarii TaxID=167371 RepID=A0A4S4KSB0_9AGAM|nr:hypothetical protein EW145_g6894 [Phellinidium pouzarii]